MAVVRSEVAACSCSSGPWVLIFLQTDGPEVQEAQTLAQAWTGTDRLTRSLFLGVLEWSHRK